MKILIKYDYKKDKILRSEDASPEKVRDWALNNALNFISGFCDQCCKYCEESCFRYAFCDCRYEEMQKKCPYLEEKQ